MAASTKRRRTRSDRDRCRAAWRWPAAQPSLIAAPQPEADDRSRGAVDLQDRDGQHRRSDHDRADRRHRSAVVDAARAAPHRGPDQLQHDSSRRPPRHADGGDDSTPHRRPRQPIRRHSRHRCVAGDCSSTTVPTTTPESTTTTTDHSPTRRRDTTAPIDSTPDTTPAATTTTVPAPAPRQRPPTTPACARRATPRRTTAPATADTTPADTTPHAAPVAAAEALGTGGTGASRTRPERPDRPPRPPASLRRSPRSSRRTRRSTRATCCTRSTARRSSHSTARCRHGGRCRPRRPTVPTSPSWRRALVALGYDPALKVTVDNHFDSATRTMVKAWQTGLGVEQTGTVTLGSVVFLPSSTTVSAVDQAVGDTVGDGDTVLTLAAPTQEVLVDVPAGDESKVVPGLAVQIGDVQGTVSRLRSADQLRHRRRRGRDRSGNTDRERHQRHRGQGHADVAERRRRVARSRRSIGIAARRHATPCRSRRPTARRSG